MVPRRINDKLTFIMKSILKKNILSNIVLFQNT